ncbi:hypothetical protein BC937DRAFT_91448 [Endogone sp. FLAS-F59071]|nr:hypothetical protein BC937DRAFT_91448 [Endogone sp. FLAS-F59071]|eukprot:RUS16248.1 hypothetical protein BC937DRAFT_91448 [Endogone sp. FLAS-F59071]
MRSFSLTIASIATSLLINLSAVYAQDGSPDIPLSTGSSPYVCDPKTCVAPACFCASPDPPGGLNGSTVPQFVTITFDDSIQSALLPTAYKMLGAAKNPNGCPALGTWFVSIQWTNFSLVEDWYAAGNEVADHTWSHVGSPPSEEISACKAALNAYAGIPRGRIQGFRAPFLNYTLGTLTEIGQQGFLYDSSATAVIDDAFWPYTLDNGLANDCWSGVCKPGSLKLPGVWEIPMHSIVDDTQTAQLMDVYLAGTSSNVTNWYNTNWMRHYNGKRAPFGIYVHPTHLTNFAGLPDTSSYLNTMTSIISSLASHQDVWFVTNQQLLQWMKNPVPASQLASQPYMQCAQPVISHEICNGLSDTHSGDIDQNLLQSCSVGNTYFSTCFNCPATEPTTLNPVPTSSVQAGQTGYRYPVPDTCDTMWWDPIGNTCLCNSTNCAYKDISQPIVLGNSTNTSTNRTGVNSSSTAGPPSNTTSSKSAAAHSVLNLVGMLVVSVLSVGVIASL